MAATLTVGTSPTAPVPVVPLSPPPAMVEDPNAPWPPVLQSPVGQTVCNYISYCRSYHSAGFFVYILLLVVVIVLVWLGNNGTISLFNAAVGVTIAVAICIGLMFVHWYWFIKGVIPECAPWSFNVSGSIATRTNANAAAAVVTPAPAMAATAPPASVAVAAGADGGVVR